MIRQHRPPLALRAFVALAGLTVGAATASLMLSDRAPGALRRLSERLDGTAPGSLATDPRLPDSYLMIHVATWAIVALLVGWGLWSWRGLAVGSVGVLILSFVVEFAQERVTATRSFAVGDLVANTAGVALGSTLAAVSYAVWDALSTQIRRRRHREQ